MQGQPEVVCYEFLFLWLRPCSKGLCDTAIMVDRSKSRTEYIDYWIQRAEQDNTGSCPPNLDTRTPYIGAESPHNQINPYRYYRYQP